MRYIDSETFSLTGPITLLQWADDDGPIKIYDLWDHGIKDGMQVIEECMDKEIIGFNLAFDCFQLTKTYGILAELANVFPVDVPLIQLLVGNEQVFLDCEEKAVLSAPALKPKGILDLMLHAQKGKYQMCLGSDDEMAGGKKDKKIVVPRVPAQVAEYLCAKLEETVKLPDILFKGRKNPKRWGIYESINPFTKKRIHGFYDLVCTMVPSSSLKNLCVDLGIADSATLFSDLEHPPYAVELEFAPYANALWRVAPEQEAFIETYLTRATKTVKTKERMKTEPFKGTWVHVAPQHVQFWKENAQARKYAEDDIHYTRELYKKFDCPPLNDDDSVLACCVANVRWRGFEIDEEKIRSLRLKCIEIENEFPDHASAPKCLRYIKTAVKLEVAKEMKDSTAKPILKEYVKKGGELGKRAATLLRAREAKKERELYEKLLVAGRLFAGFKVIGTVSSRMSGSSGLNPQGIKKAKYVRSAFPLGSTSRSDMLCGGDFDAFEVGIAQAVSGDQALYEQITSGKKIHGLFGASMYGMTYDEVLATDGTEDNKYTKAKSGVFLMFYGGGPNKLATTLGVTVEQAEKGLADFKKAFPGAGKMLDYTVENYSPLISDGSGFKLHGCMEYAESMFGFKRHFGVELSAIKQLFALTQNVFGELNRVSNELCVRSEHKGEQTVGGAALSALYNAMFAIQNSMQRQAGNHRIQSTGAQATKRLQCEIWDLQPQGVHPFVVQPMQIHDEIMCVASPGVTDDLRGRVISCIRYLSDTIPLIEMDWKTGMQSWSEK